MDNTSTLADAHSRIADLEHQLAAALRAGETYEQRLIGLKATLSWRLTAPFREVYRALRKGMLAVSAWRLSSLWDRKAWKKFFRELERQFRMLRRKGWKKKEEPVLVIKPLSPRATQIHADLQTAVQRQRKVA